MDDQTETFFINLLRGSSLRGLKAMEPKNDLLIRPLLFANQHDILTYIGNNNLSYRTDSSNKSNKYLRNQIRNQIIPLLCEIDPNANAGIKKSIELLSLNFNLYNELVTQALQTVCTKQNNLIEIDKKALLRFNNWDTVLWEILSTFGFDSQLMPSITKSINNEPGKKFYSQTHRMVIDRENLEIIGLEHISSEEINIVTDMALFTKAGFQLKFDRLIRSSDFNPDTDPDLAFTDHDQIQFPLVVRTWQKGDRFFPLGLAGSKLVSDYFSDHKFSLSQKEQARLLCNANGDIIWIIGHRLDDRYSIKTTTKNILKISCKRI
jgi:tRNA(Ile)-lysidine synthase